MSPPNFRKAANAEALQLLSQVRRIVEPKPAPAMLAEARAALPKLQRIIHYLQDTDAQAPERMPTELEIAMLGVRESLDELLDPFGFCLLVFEIGEDARLSWVTKAGVREADVAELMQHYIAAHGAREET